MHRIEEALSLIISSAPRPTRKVDVPLDDALGRVLAQDAVADHDAPPFERSSMDGWAVRAADVMAPGAQLRISGRIMAGDMPTERVGPGQTMKVMTGAPVPEGADAVVKVEESEEDPAGETVTLTAATHSGKNICHRGEDLRTGDVIVPAGTFLDASAVSLVALAGHDPVSTWAVPSVAVVPTGDELQEPGGLVLPPGKIRETNGFLMGAQVRGVSPALRPLRPGIARDDEASISAMIDVGVDHDVLCFSGGVSMGDLDLVRTVLDARGFEVLVEKVAIKPGKPLVAGRLQGPDGHTCMVFGLPGNPVSTYVSFELFVRPYLLRFMGQEDVAPDMVSARLKGGRPLKSNARGQYVPASVVAMDGGLMATPVEWHGSGDMRGAADANGFIVLEPGAPPPEPGDFVRTHLIAGRSLRLPGSRLREAQRD